MVTGLAAYKQMSMINRSENRAELIADIWFSIASYIQSGISTKDSKEIETAKVLVQDGLIGTWCAVEDDNGLSQRLISLYRWFMDKLTIQTWVIDKNELEPLIKIAKEQEDAWRTIAKEH